MTKSKHVFYFSQTTAQKINIPLSKFMHNADEGEMPLQYLMLGGFKILGFGAEVSSHWPDILKVPFASQQFILSGYVGHSFGYLPTDKQVTEGGYEVDGFRRGLKTTGYYRNDISIHSVLEHYIQKLELTSQMA